MKNYGEVVKKFNPRGFGFIKDLDTNAEIFFHVSGCNDSFEQIEVGDRVSFEVGQDRQRRAMALHVEVARPER